MKLSPEELDRLTALAGLSPGMDEPERLSGDISRIFEFVDRLHQIDTEGVEPLADVHDQACRPEEDVDRPSLPRETALALADTEGYYYRFPPVLPESGEQR